MRRLLALLYRRTPAPLLILLLFQLAAVLLLPVSWLSWLMLWCQLGFCVQQGVGERYPGPFPIRFGRLAWWSLREGLCWPVLFYRHCKESSS